MKRPAPKTDRTCDTCSIGIWYDVQWNRSLADGKPITKHCRYGGKGLLRGTPACDKYTQNADNVK